MAIAEFREESYFTTVLGRAVRTRSSLDSNWAEFRRAHCILMHLKSRNFFKLFYEDLERSSIRSINESMF